MKIFKGVTVFTAIVLAVTLLSFSQKKEEKLKEVSVQTSSETKVALKV